MSFSYLSILSITLSCVKPISFLRYSRPSLTLSWRTGLARSVVPTLIPYFGALPSFNLLSSYLLSNTYFRSAFSFSAFFFSSFFSFFFFSSSASSSSLCSNYRHTYSSRGILSFIFFGGFPLALSSLDNLPNLYLSSDVSIFSSLCESSTI